MQYTIKSSIGIANEMGETLFTVWDTKTGTNAEMNEENKEMFVLFVNFFVIKKTMKIILDANMFGTILNTKKSGKNKFKKANK